MAGEHGNLSDLEARLLALVEARDPRRVVLVLGSGISNSVVPSVSAMVEIFAEQLDKAGKQRIESIREADSATPTLVYQNAAATLQHRLGAAAVARAVRRGVLEACGSVAASDRWSTANSVTECRELEASGNWSVPDAHRNIARFVQSLPVGQRGPIITTNFDPLMGIALREGGIDVEVLPMAHDQAVPLERYHNSTRIPILHVHGFWTEQATLHGLSQLTRPRPALEGLLRDSLRDSIFVILGYSGWPDAFMKQLEARIDEADLLGGEVLWACFDESIVIGSPVASLVGVPGVSIYCSIDANALQVAQSSVRPDSPSSASLSAPRGFDIVEVNLDYSRRLAEKFADGFEPTWADAAAWPILSGSDRLWETAERVVVQGDARRVVVAAGPVGEGKTMALRQTALRLQTHFPDWTVIWRRPGAPALTEDWFEAVRQSGQQVAVFIDEADLVEMELVSTQPLWHANHDVVIVLGMHDRAWGGLRAKFNSEAHEVPFGGVEPGDARKISDRWEAFELVDGSNDPEVVANSILESAEAGRLGSTLFGALLEVRVGNKLESRVSDLVDKLNTVRVTGASDVTLGDVFVAICLMQVYGSGASRNLVAAVASVSGIFADGKILIGLGKEAAVSFAGNKVYARHPAIAQLVVDQARASGQLLGVAKQVGRAGGWLRDGSGADANDYREAYVLSRSLSDKAEAIAAADGTLEGASRLLEARVTRIAVLRKHDRVQARIYADAVAQHLNQFNDLRHAVRGFLNEMSIVYRDQSEPTLGAGFAALALADDVGFSMSERIAGYALFSLYRSALDLKRQESTQLHGAAEAAYLLAGRLPHGVDLLRKQFAGQRTELESLPESARDAIKQLAKASAPAAEKAAKVLSNIGVPGRVTFNDLARMVGSG